MINFSEELKKYKPVLETDQVEEAVNSNDIHDFMEILQSLVKKAKLSDKE